MDSNKSFNLPPVPVGWKYIRLGDVIEAVIDNRGKTPPLENIGVKLLETKHLSRGTLYPAEEISNQKYVSFETYETWFRKHLQPYDILFSTVGSQFPQWNLVGEEVDFCIAQNLVGLRPDEDVISPWYLLLAISHPVFLHQVSGYTITTAQPSIRVQDLLECLILYPPEPVRSLAVDLYSGLQRKIEANRRQNETLEATARAIFKSWFVDFEPVHYKARGEQPPGMDAETADLFPDRFEESELGLIPAGWGVASLDEVADYLNGLAMQKYPPIDSEYLPVMKIRELRQGFVDENSGQASPDIDPKYIIQDGDVVFSWSGSLLLDIWTGGIAGLNQHLFKVTSRDFPRWFFYFWTQHHLEEFQRIAAFKATTMGHIRRSHLSEAKVVVPSQNLLEQATYVIEPIVESIINNRLQSRTLAKTRDTLLPKLISGELRVDDIAEQI